MKLIIDIPEMAYEAYKEWHKNKVATAEQSLIANGIPYEEKPKYFPPCEDCNKKMEEIRQAYDKMKAMERPHCKWNIEHDWVHCSSCGHEQNYPSNFCPNCSVDKGLQERAISDLYTAIEDTYKKLGVEE